MGSPTVEKLTRIKLGHSFAYRNRHGWNPRYDSLVSVYPLPLTRPERGAQARRFTCPACEKELVMVVSSIERTRALRRSWVLLGIVLLGYFVASVALTFLLPQARMGIPYPVFPLTDLFTSLLVGGVGGYLALHAWLIEDGIRGGDYIDAHGKRHRGWLFLRSLLPLRAKPGRHVLRWSEPLLPPRPWERF